jgi:predicted small lipoprotein YifL
MKRRLLLAACAALAAGGCGQKGPLYLPDKNAKVVTTPAGSAMPAAPAAETPAAPAAETPAGTALPAGAAPPAAAPARKPNDEDQDSQPQQQPPAQPPTTTPR